MKYPLPSLLLLLLPLSAIAQTENHIEIPVYEGAVFYDGYRLGDNPDNDLDDGILRHSCSLYSQPLTDAQLDVLGSELLMNVTVEACCDNYDRIGNINLALVPKGQETYATADVDRIEIARFITPFMDMNKQPNQVPYDYDISYLSPILRDKTLRDTYDFWLEFELFGVPYAANQQIKGCEGRSDVFKGYLTFATSTDGTGECDGNTLIPIVIKKPEYIASNLNNYTESGTDEIGKCIKTYRFNVERDVVGAQLVLITSNHGANSGGEEYNRRDHFIYLDGEQVLQYKPGRNSCEPFRKYNTQPNGIYGQFKKSDKSWQSFSNWCPGDVIDTRIIYLGDFAAGMHEFTISVPDAVFKDKQGDIPVSLYFMAGKENEMRASAEFPESSKARLTPVRNGSMLTLAGDSTGLTSVMLHSADGECLCHTTKTQLNISVLPEGIYILTLEYSDGFGEIHKLRL